MASASAIGSADLHHKMCKKIALLTKVIYHLNIKNEDHESDVSMMKQQHADEMESASREAAEKLKNLAEIVASTHAKDVAMLEEALQTLRDTTAKASEEALQEFGRRGEEYRKSLSEMRGIFTERSAAMAKDLNDTRQAFEEKMTSASKIIDELRNQLKQEQEQSASVKAAGEQRYAAMVCEYDTKLSDGVSNLQKVKQDAEHASSAAAAALETLRQDNANEMRTMSLTFAAERHGCETKIVELSDIIQDAERKLHKTEDDFAGLKVALSLSEGKAKELVADLFESNTKYKAEHDLVLLLQQRIRDLEDKTSTMSELSSTEVEMLKRRLSAESAALQQSKQEAVALRDQLHECNTEHAAALTAVKQQLADALDRTAKSAAEIARMTAEISRLQKLLAAAQELSSGSIQSANAQLENLQKQLEAEKADFGRQLAEMQAKLVAATNSCEEAQDQIFRMKAEAAATEASLRLMSETERASLDQRLREEHSKHLEDLIADYHKQLLEKEKLAGSVKESHDKQIHELNDTINRLRIDIQNAQEQGGSASDRLKRVLDESALLQSKLAHAEKRVSEVEAKLTSNESLSNSYLRQVQTLTDQLEETKRRAQVSLVELQNSHRDAMERQKTDSARELMLAQQAKETALSALRQQYETRLAGLSAVADNERSKFSGSLFELQALYDKVCAESGARIKDLEAALQQQTASAEQEMKQQRETFARQLEDQLKNQTIAHAQATEVLKRRLEAELESGNLNAKRSLQSLEDRLRAQHASEIDDLRRQLAAQTSASFDALKLQQEAAISSLQEQLKESKADSDDLRSQLQAAINQNSQLLQAMQEEAHKFERQTTELKSAFSIKLREAETNWQAELNHKQSAWEEEVARINQAHNSAKQAHVLELENAQRQYAELDEKYQSRDSRPEDVMRIKKLAQIVKSMEEDLRKAQDELKFFKLELINRETNFNKVFNRNPTVGVLQVASDGKGTTSASSSIGNLASTTLKPSTGPLVPHTSSRSLTGAGVAVLSSTSASTNAQVRISPGPDDTPLDTEDEDFGVDDKHTPAAVREQSRGSAGSAGSIAASRPVSAKDTPKTPGREKAAETPTAALRPPRAPR